MNKSYKDTFKSTAWYYARYRAGYPEAFFDTVKEKFNLSRSDRVLDLGCGTGQIALPICQYVKEVLAMDPEPEMLVEGKIQAEKAGAVNIRWIEGGSEDLVDLEGALGKFKLAVVGTAFHWMNQEKTLDDLYEMINNGGGIVIASINDTLSKHPVINRVIKKWLGEERRAGSGVYRQPERRFEAVIAESKFTKIEFLEYKLSYVNDIDSVVGYIYSTSSANRNVLGDKREEFEKDLREALLKNNPSGKFVDEGQAEAILAWK